MTVSLPYKMQNNNNNNNSNASMTTSKKQRPPHLKGNPSATVSETSMSCIPATHVSTQNGEEELTTVATAARNTQQESISEHTNGEFKQECLIPEFRPDTSPADAGRCSTAGVLVNGEVSASREWRSEGEDTFTSNGLPVPPPSLASNTSTDQTTGPSKVPTITEAAFAGLSVLTDIPCVKISEDVPVPTRTDVMATVSREALPRDALSVKDEDSDAFASGEELDVDKRSEYSTADEGDCETQYKKKVEVLAQSAIYEDGGSSSDNISLEHSDSRRRDQCGLTFATLTSDSEALKPVLVRQVSRDEEVKVTCDDDDEMDQEIDIADRDSCTPRSLDTNQDEPEKCETRDNPDESVIPDKSISLKFVTPEVSATPKQDVDDICVKGDETQDISTTQISKQSEPILEQGSCDGATEQVQWKDEEGCAPGGGVGETVAETVSQKSYNLQVGHPKICGTDFFRCSTARWKSLPVLPMSQSPDSNKAGFTPATSIETLPANSMYPTNRSVGECETALLPLQSTVNQQQVKDFRVRQAMAVALSLCEEELGPVALALAKLQEKVRRLNIPEISTQNRTVPSLMYGQPNYLPPAPSISSIIRKNPRVNSPLRTPASRCSPTQQQGRSQLSTVSRIDHQTDCVCSYCGLQVGREANMSPVARMYVLLAQPHRTSKQEEGGSRLQ